MERLPAAVREVLTTLEQGGREAWCVGGCVRDLRLGRTPGDWDVATSALPEETMALFPGRALPTGLRHGTVTVRTPDGGVEVTTFRKDGCYRDHRRPEQVTFTPSLEEDLRRRDFTVNAMALNLRGEARDPFGGGADLAAGVLRCVGEPMERLEEDALRVLRGLRFAATLGLRAAPATKSALHESAVLLERIAPERIQTELTKLLCGPFAATVLRAYPDVIGVFWPEILPMVGFGQRNRHHCHDVWEHTLHALEAVPAEPVLRYTIFLHDIGKPGTFTVDTAGVGHFYGHPSVSRTLAEELLTRLRVDNETRAAVVRLVDWHDRNIPRTDQGLRRALRRLGEQDLRRLLAVKRADNLAQAPAYLGRQTELDEAESILDKLLAEDACVSLRTLAVNGRDMLALGYVGPGVGAALERLLDAVVDGDLPNERTALLEYARRERAANEGGEDRRHDAAADTTNQVPKRPTTNHCNCLRRIRHKVQQSTVENRNNEICN